jgi:hypothetical protein
MHEVEFWQFPMFDKEIARILKPNAFFFLVSDAISKTRTKYVDRSLPYCLKRNVNGSNYRGIEKSVHGHFSL